MTDLKLLSEKIGINYHYLSAMMSNSDKYYYTFYIKKKSGDDRVIDSPSYKLKAIQGWLLRNILEKYSIHERATGFVRHKSIKHNAKYHLDKRYIMCLDIKDFFHSIKYPLILDIFKQTHDSAIAEKFAKACTFKNYLPQGGVTSPILSNIAFAHIDNEITSLADRMDINYSRYADDLTFSSNTFDNLKIIQSKVLKLLENNGFMLNARKTRFMTGKQRKAVTGVILNSGRLTIGRKRKRMVRSMLYNLIKKKDEKVSENELIGHISFIRDIEPEYYKKLCIYRDTLIGK